MILCTLFFPFFFFFNHLPHRAKLFLTIISKFEQQQKNSMSNGGYIDTYGRKIKIEWIYRWQHFTCIEFVHQLDLNEAFGIFTFFGLNALMVFIYSLKMLQGNFHGSRSLAVVLKTN